MRSFHIFICVTLLGVLVWMSRSDVVRGESVYGGLSWTGWASLLTIVVVAGIVFIFNDTARAVRLFRRGRIKVREMDPVRTLNSSELKELGIDKYRGPSYPHPVIFPDRCIGCQACVDACPHDVLAIVDGIAAAVAPDLCMEDTSCQAECPVNPKACIVINTTKPVVTRPAPSRDSATYQTNVRGCYIVGDVSGVPLIKNAVKEGYEVIDHIVEDLANSPSNTEAEYDVAIIGVGPGGASAAAAAQKAGLKYVAIEQGPTLASIEAYPKGKYIYFKPDTKEWYGGLPLSGLGIAKKGDSADPGTMRSSVAGDQRENILRVWLGSLAEAGVRVNEFESCNGVTPVEGKDHFAIDTEVLADKSQRRYLARRVVLAVGLRGSPNRLGLPNEDMSVSVGGKLDPKVLYSLANSEDFRDKRIVIVGGGNVAVEAAVDLVSRRQGTNITPRPAGDINSVTLLVRTSLAPTVKFGNKFQLYHCAELGIIDLRFGVGIKEMREHEVVLEDVRTGEEIETIPNDYVFALIGGERPDRFLESIGITLT
jgi:thioredoxin reductase (NADPH)